MIPEEAFVVYYLKQRERGAYLSVRLANDGETVTSASPSLAKR